jgi:hypothetical protein
VPPPPVGRSRRAFSCVRSHSATPPPRRTGCPGCPMFWNQGSRAAAGVLTRSRSVGPRPARQALPARCWSTTPRHPAQKARRSRSAPRRSHAASTRPHARPRCDAPPPAAAPTADPAAVHAMRGGHHLVVAPPVRVEHIPRAATRPKHRPQVVRRLMSGEENVRSGATRQPQARRCRRMTTHRRVLRAPCLRLPLASPLTMTRTRGLRKLRQRSLLPGPDDPSRLARSPSILGATAGRDRARPRRD